MKFNRFAGAAVVALALGVAACGESDDATTPPASSGGGSSSEQTALSGNLAGAGSSAQDAAQQAWIAGFQDANPDATISYDPVGSGGGREQFISGGVAYAGSDAALKEDELTKAQARCGGPDGLVEVPVYISPIAIAYNLAGVDNLQLSPETLAKIMKQEIKTWNDPAIKADNPDANLPGDRITVVNRSDESGTTQNFTDYLHQAAPDVWTFDADQVWPVKGGEAAQGTSGVVDAIKNGKGTIGYADESQARELGIAKIKVGEEYVGPTPEAAAKILEASKKTEDPGKNVFTFTVARTTDDATTYPIVLVSYAIACTKYDDAAQGKLVGGYLKYVISADGQAAGSKNAGSAPLSDSLRTQIQPAVDAIGAG
ncbi:phosphate ABC transporter substrate-binding protein PstS [Solirubrobacter soli]|uniref:phosphate ABC transporter substrate-binding protein PstS n=1 Tax=Solirubrobacter soli TaxID=363832 RepID=UPI000423A3BC|nr:phosphate ABC transporter substrate-binding protein PstS [Solirubrobacter soli]